MGKNREWIQATLAHRATGAVPYNLGFTPYAAARVKKHFGVDDLAEAFDVPVRMNATKSIKPLYADPAEFGPYARDEFGVTWSTCAIDRGSPWGVALPEPSLKGYAFPPADPAYRYEDLGAWCARNRAHYTILWVGDLWERATFLRGMENILLDLVLHHRFVEELLRRLADRILATLAILFERFEFDGIAVSDDYGAQQSLLMSPADWRQLIRPLLAEIYAFAKKNGRTVFHHSCGHVTPIIPDLIEIGLDILHPIQPETMDIFQLKREFGRDLTFCGGVRTQDLLPRGSPRAIRAEVRKLQRILGKGGGYILEPGITLQADIPLANLLALIDAARNQ